MLYPPRDLSLKSIYDTIIICFTKALILHSPQEDILYRITPSQLLKNLYYYIIPIHSFIHFACFKCTE